MSKAAVFWDRDGTLIEDPGYLARPEQVRLLDGAAEALGLLARAGFENIIVTNQSGLARGLLDEPTLERIHARLQEQLRAQGVQADAIYYCPYLDGPEATVERYRQDSDLRKPRPGMLVKAALERNLDLAACWMIGNHLHDTQAGRAAGCRTILLAPATTDQPAGARDGSVDFVAGSPLEAARIVLRHTAGAAESRPPTHPTETAPMSDPQTVQLLNEILSFLRMVDRRAQTREFSPVHLAAWIVQVIAAALAAWALLGWLLETDSAVVGPHLMRTAVACYLQLLAATLFAFSRTR